MWKVVNTEKVIIKHALLVLVAWYFALNVPLASNVIQVKEHPEHHEWNKQAWHPRTPTQLNWKGINLPAWNKMCMLTLWYAAIETMFISMGLCKKDITPVLQQWNYVFLALTHRYTVMILCYWFSLSWNYVISFCERKNKEHKITTAYVNCFNCIYPHLCLCDFRANVRFLGYGDVFISHRKHWHEIIYPYPNTCFSYILSIFGTVAKPFLEKCCSHGCEWIHINERCWVVCRSLQWRHEHNGVSNHWGPDCLLNCFLRHRSKKISKLCDTGLCEGNSPVTDETPAQRVSNGANASIWWQHHISMG